MSFSADTSSGFPPDITQTTYDRVISHDPTVSVLGDTVALEQQQPAAYTQEHIDVATTLEPPSTEANAEQQPKAVAVSEGAALADSGRDTAAVTQSSPEAVASDDSQGSLASKEPESDPIVNDDPYPDLPADTMRIMDVAPPPDSDGQYVTRDVDTLTGAERAALEDRLVSDDSSSLGGMVTRAADGTLHGTVGGVVSSDDAGEREADSPELPLPSGDEDMTPPGTDEDPETETADTIPPTTSASGDTTLPPADTSEHDDSTDNDDNDANKANDTPPTGPPIDPPGDRGEGDPDEQRLQRFITSETTEQGRTLVTRCRISPAELRESASEEVAAFRHYLEEMEPAASDNAFFVANELITNAVGNVRDSDRHLLVTSSSENNTALHVVYAGFGETSAKAFNDVEKQLELPLPVVAKRLFVGRERKTQQPTSEQAGAETPPAGNFGRELQHFTTGRGFALMNALTENRGIERFPDGGVYLWFDVKSHKVNFEDILKEAGITKLEDVLAIYADDDES